MKPDWPSQPNKHASLSDAAEDWCRSQGLPVPSRDDPEWLAMYDQFVDHTFAPELSHAAS